MVDRLRRLWTLASGRRTTTTVRCATTSERRAVARDDRRRRRLPRGQLAYNLVVLTVAVTLLNIFVAVNLPLWSHQIQRDKDAELIFRGMQYAEAIRVFQTRHQRLPSSFKELLETEPRAIRQLWPNPFTEDGSWCAIPEGTNVQQRPKPNTGLEDLNQGNGARGSNGLDGDGFGDDSLAPPPCPIKLSVATSDSESFGQPPATVKFRGVYHAGSGEEPTRSFLGRQSYSEWQFTVDLVSGTLAEPDNPSLVRPFLAEVIGKPWPPGVVPLVPQPSSEPPQRQGRGPSPTRPPDGSGHPTGLGLPEPEPKGDQGNQKN